MVHASGAVGAVGDSMIRGLLNHLAAQALTFEQAGEDVPKRPGFWTALRDSHGNQLPDRFRLAVADQPQACKVVDLLHDKAISVGSNVISIVAMEDGMQLAQSKNGRRGRGRKPTPPQ